MTDKAKAILAELIPGPALEAEIDCDLPERSRKPILGKAIAPAVVTKEQMAIARAKARAKLKSTVAAIEPVRDSGQGNTGQGPRAKPGHRLAKPKPTGLRLEHERRFREYLERIEAKRMLQK